MMLFVTRLLYFASTALAYHWQNLGHLMKLGWEFEGDYVYLKFECKTEGWCGISFSKNNSDILIVWYDDGPRSYDGYAVKHGGLLTDVQQGGSNDLYVISGTEANGLTTVDLMRKKLTYDNLDVVFEEGKALSVDWAVHSSDAFNSCGETRGSSILDFDADDDSEDYDVEYIIHGIRASTIWGLLVPIAVLAARFFKWHWLWYWVHFILGSIAILVTFYGVVHVSGTNTQPYPKLEDNKLAHSRMAFLLASFVAGHGIFGLALRVIMKKTHKPYKLAVMRNLHFAVGWTLTIVGMIEVYGGWSIYEEKYCAIVIAYYCCLFSIFCFLELWSRYWYLYPRLSCRGHLSNMTHAQVMREVFQNQKQLAFCDELVLDVSKFADSHPGGKLLIEDALGEDFGKYMNGCSSYGKGANPYYHSEPARLMVEKLAIGLLKYPEEFLIDSQGSKNYLETQWHLVAKSDLAGSSTLLLSYSNPRFTINKPSGVEWLGRHFRMACYDGGKYIYRYYSAVVCMAPDIYSQWKGSLNASTMIFTKSELNYSLVSEGEEPISPSHNLLHLIIKQYKPYGKVSQFAAGMKIGEYVYLKGPLGPGLCLDEDSKGLHLGFAGGTGIVPFLDLVYLLWRAENKQEVIGLNKDFKLWLYVAFRSYNDAFALDVLQKTHELCVSNFSDRFRLHVYISDEQETGKLSDSLLESAINGEKVHLGWACGPSAFNRWICEMLQDQGISRTRIVLL
mmetsp:Transcript_28892/g.51535  ORF Transcript_28892/g.51535 Transcript_28892/m.51535 type:complete len:732 (+) Transcript_28892:28-2223(+)